MAPRLPETDVAEADGGPGEDGAQSRGGQEPGEGFFLRRRGGDEGEKAEYGSEDDGE